MSRQPDEWTQTDTDNLGDIASALSDTVVRLRAEVVRLRAELEAAKAENERLMRLIGFEC